jgi:hypothetical protein
MSVAKRRKNCMFLLDMAFFFIFIFLTVAAIIIHRAHALHDTTRRGAVDGTYWGAYSHSVTPAPVAPPKQDHGPKVVNGKLVLPKVVRGSGAALAGKTSYGGRR